MEMSKFSTDLKAFFYINDKRILNVRMQNSSEMQNFDASITDISCLL